MCLAFLWMAPLGSLLGDAKAREVADLPRSFYYDWFAEQRPACPSGLSELRERAGQGDVRALVSLGNLYKTGCGGKWIPLDRSKAAQLYRRAALQEDGEGQYQLGLLHYGDRVYDRAIAWFRRAAAGGHQDAIARLHAMYSLRHGVPADQAEAITWFHDAAGNGDFTAVTQLGIIHQFGYGVDQDLKAAVAYYGQAAQAGDPRAQIRLGTMYKEGHGVSPDLVRAYMWYAIATTPASNYSDIAHQRVDEVSRLMTHAQAAEAQRLARDWITNRSRHQHGS